MANNTLNISIPLKFELKTPPRGTTDYDTKTLSPDQQRELNFQRLRIRTENIVYMEEHREVKALVTLILRRAITQKPKDVVEFIARFFTRPQEVIEKEVLDIINESDIQSTPIPYAKYEDWDY